MNTGIIQRLERIITLIDQSAPLSKVKEHVMSTIEHAQAAEAAHAKLGADYSALEKHHAKLNEAHMQLKTQTAQGEIDAIKIKVLQMLATAGDMHVGSIAQHLQSPEAVAQMHLDELANKGMVLFLMGGWNAPSTWTIVTEGTRYLVNRKLI